MEDIPVPVYYDDEWCQNKNKEIWQEQPVSIQTSPVFRLIKPVSINALMRPMSIPVKILMKPVWILLNEVSVVTNETSSVLIKSVLIPMKPMLILI